MRSGAAFDSGGGKYAIRKAGGLLDGEEKRVKKRAGEWVGGRGSFARGSGCFCRLSTLRPSDFETFGLGARRSSHGGASQRALRISWAPHGHADEDVGAPGSSRDAPATEHDPSSSVVSLFSARLAATPGRGTGLDEGSRKSGLMNDER
jgi:hypothetical protein